MRPALRCPKKKTTRPGESTEKDPYLLQQVVISRPNQVWSADITSIRLSRGFVYLCAILDWFSRYVVSWELSNSQDAFFCVSALENALRLAKPEIFNSDQGSQFTKELFTQRLKRAKIAISRDGQRLHQSHWRFFFSPGRGHLFDLALEFLG